MFFSAAPVSADIRDWIEDSFAWEYEDGGHAAWRSAARLVLPTRDFFDVPSGRDQATAMAVCRQIQKHLGHAHRQFVLEPITRLDAQYRHEYGNLSEIAGTYEYDETAPVIRYDAEAMARPLSFINTMAHEVMHDMLYEHALSLPGGLEGHELATDLFCIIRGFGLFQLQAAQDAGWSGYLSQQSRAWALGRYLTLAGIDPGIALGHLSARPVKLLKQALKAQAKLGYGDEITTAR